eukprot:474759_1
MELKVNDCEINNLKYEFENNRSHEPQLVLVIHGTNNMHNELDTSTRKHINELIMNIWDTYKPISMSSNCGATNQNNLLHWKFDYEANSGYKIFLQNLMHQENNEKHKRIIYNHLIHYLKTYKQWLNVKNRGQLVQIEGDVQLYQELLGVTEVFQKAPHKYANIIPINKNIRFDHEKNECVFSAQSTTLFIEIPTICKQQGFKMISYKDKINDALDMLINFVTNKSKSIRSFIEYKIGEIKAKKYDQSLKWFELSITTETKNIHSNVVIMVKCQISILHYLFIMLFKHSFEYNIVQNWFDKYIKFINNKLKRKGNEEVACEHPHHILVFDKNNKKLETFYQKNKKLEIYCCKKKFLRNKDKNQSGTDCDNKENSPNRDNRKYIADSYEDEYQSHDEYDQEDQYQ